MDATRKGGAARFINHSCDPNCFTRIITVDTTKHICIYAKKKLEVGEELCYDYKVGAVTLISTSGRVWGQVPSLTHAQRFSSSFILLPT